MKYNDAKDDEIKELLESFQIDRSQELWKQIYNRYHERIYRFNLSMGVKKEDAQDLAQDILIKVYYQIHTLKNPTSFEPWLFRMTHNFCINHLKAKRKHPNVGLDSVDHKCSIQDSDDDYEKEKITRQIYDEVCKILRKLPNETQRMINLKYLENYTSRALTDVFDLNESAIKMRLSRAKKLVRRNFIHLPS